MSATDAPPVENAETPVELVETPVELVETPVELVETSSRMPALHAPPSQRLRWWTMLGWIAVVVGMVVWTGVNVRFGVSWQNRWVTTAPSNQNWNSGDVTLSVTEVRVEKTIPASSEYSQPMTAAPGAVWVIVLLDYTLADPAVGAYCMLNLMGEGREWSTIVSASAPTIADVAPEARWGCTNKDSDGNLVTGGSFGQIFEVPESAVDEVWGLRIFASQGSPQITGISQALKLHNATVILPVTVPS